MFLTLWALVLGAQLQACFSQEYPLPPPPDEASCAFGLDENSSPLDCYHEAQANEADCLKRGCCWHVSPTPGRPFCYYTENFSPVKQTINGSVALLDRVYRSQFPGDVNSIRLELGAENHISFKFVDVKKERWVPPYPKLTNTNFEKISSLSRLQAKIGEDGTLMKITRDGKQITKIPLSSFIFSDQFVQLTFELDGALLYGVGEHRTRLVLDDKWTKYTMWNHDAGPTENTNLYGSHPFLLAVKPGNDATGIYFHNSNAVEVVIQPGPKVTFRSIGGILQFHILEGPTPADVISQYTKLVGLPPMPPYWALGYHLCRWGYGSASNTRAVWQRMRDNKIPFDVQWNDIDYMRQNNDFTIDPVNFADLPDLINDIHEAGMHYVPMLDPGVSGSEVGEYHPFSDGVEMDVFVKDINGNIMFGHVWNPNATAFPDFTHPRAYEYWSKQLREFRDVVKYDAIWLDMNEPSNFADGSPSGCPDSPLETPPYVPPVAGGKLQAGTICMSSQHAVGSHYNVHNMYGIAEADVTRRAIENIIGKRSFIISRASFPGMGHYSGHWSGDNNAAWSEMVASIVELLTFSLYGVPFMGADICGFNGEADRELCNRWSQLGSFYTFSRNHNIIGTRDQDPASFDDEVTASIRKALSMRYMLLPYLYTLFYHAQVSGTTVARPLFFEFPDDVEALRVDRAFLWGSGLYIVPVLEQGATSVTAYLPDARWFSFEGFEEINEKGFVTLNAPFDTIPLLLRGGSIIPVQEARTTTTESRKQPLSFLVVPDSQGNASGSLFWDDGESLDPVSNGQYGVVNVTLSGQTIKSDVHWNTEALPYGNVVVLGVKSASQVTVNGLSAQYNFDSNALTIILQDLKLSDSIEIHWT